MKTFLSSSPSNHTRRTRGNRTARFGPALEALENRIALALASADVFARFQDTVNNPPAITSLITADTQAFVGPSNGTGGQARASNSGRLQSFSGTAGIAGDPGVMNPSAASTAQARRTSQFIVQGAPAGTSVVLDATLNLRGFLNTKNFASLAAELSSVVSVQIVLTNSAGSQSVVGSSSLRKGELTASGVLDAADFTRAQGSSDRTPHYDIDLTRKLDAAFEVTAGEVFTVETTLFTSGFVQGPFELFTTADFFQNNNGLTLELDAPAGGTVVPVDEADLHLTRTGFSGPVSVGDTVSYTLTVRNDGPNAANEVALTDSLHDGLTLISATPSRGTVVGDEHTLVYSFGALLPGQDATVAVVVRADRLGTFTRAANVTAREPDFDQSDNVIAITTTTQAGVADLAVGVVDEQDPVRIDRAIPYAITVTNRGPDTATRVRLRQTLSGSGAALFSYSSIAGQVDEDFDELTIDLIELAPGASVTIRTGFFADGRAVDAQCVVGVSAFESDPTPLDQVDVELTTLAPAPTSLYDFTIIARGDAFNPPSINNRGKLSFVRTSGTASGTSELQTRSEAESVPVASTIIADASAQFEFFGLYQTINDSGAVAFWGLNDSNPAGTGIFTGSGGPVTTIADATGPLDRFGASPSINNAGLIAFRSAFDAGGVGIFLGQGAGPGPAVPIVDDAGPLAELHWPNVNDHDQVAFHATLDAGGEGIFLWDRGAVTTLVDSSGPFDRFSRRVSLNDQGEVAFAATLDNGESGIFVAENGVIRVYVDSSGPFRDFDDVGLTSVAINNRGVVAFRATLDSGLFGVFTGPDPEADRVLVRGDTTFGTLVTDVAVDWHGLNDAGQLALLVVLRNGAALVVRADFADHDVDGVPDAIERGAPGGGDGNADGILDQLQRHVTSLPNAVDGRYLTVVAPPNSRLLDVRSADAPVPSFPLGVIGFTVDGVAIGSAIDVQVIAPGDLAALTWYKLQPGPAFYSFEFDGTTGARAFVDTIHGDPVTRFTLAFVDGNARGDEDGLANGRIIDPGGPALLTAPIAVADSYQLDEDQVLTVNGPGVLANDAAFEAQPPGLVIASPPIHGSLALFDDGGFRYAPQSNFYGIDTFRYQTIRGGLASEPAVVTITVNPVLDAVVDIKPDGVRNAIRLRGRPHLKVAIVTAAVGTEDDILDARALDVRSIRLGDPRAAKRVGPARHQFVDVNRDGVVDLLLYFSRRAIRRSGALRAGSTAATLRGFARAFDGSPQPFEGKDSLRIVRRKRT